MRSEEPVSILIPDGESHDLLFVANCLSQLTGITLYVMSSRKRIAMRFSRYIHHFSYHPRTADCTEWVGHINREMAKFPIDIIMPVSQFGFETLAEHADLLDARQKLVPLTSWNKFSIANNKAKLSRHLAEHSLPVPNSHVVEGNKPFDPDPVDIPLPWLLKPSENAAGGEGIVKCQTREDVAAFLLSEGNGKNYVIQEFIQGHDLGCNVLCDRGEILAYTIQKGFLWTRKPFSPQIGLEFIADENIYKNIAKLMRSLEWSGVANIDLIYDEAEGCAKILEINPRFWLTLDASAIAGVNFPYLYALYARGIQFKMPSCKLVRYLNMKGLVHSIGKNPMMLFRFNFIWNHTQFKFAVKDPLVITYHFLWRTKNVIANKLKLAKRESA